MYEYELEHICSVSVKLQNPAEIIGPMPEGLRLNIYLEGGEVVGPHLNGKVRPVGADWLTIRSDGVGILDICATFETRDGALIYVAYQGMADAGSNGYQKFLGGKLPDKVPIRGAPRFHTSHPKYLWLNRIQCLNVGEADLVNWIVVYNLSLQLSQNTLLGETE